MYSFEETRRVYSTTAQELGLIFSEDNHTNKGFPNDTFSFRICRRRRLGPMPLPITKRVLIINGQLDHHERTVEESSYRPDNPEDIGKKYLREVDEILNTQPLAK